MSVAGAKWDCRCVLTRGLSVCTRVVRTRCSADCVVQGLRIIGACTCACNYSVACTAQQGGKEDQLYVYEHISGATWIIDDEDKAEIRALGANKIY